MIEDALRRGWENLFLRLDGPLHMRVILQPAVAGFLAIRAGLRDARNHQPAFLWSVFTNPGQRRELLRQGWKDIGKVFLIALVLDGVYQVIVHSAIYPLEMLLTASLLALVPYVLLRGPVGRLASRRRTTRSPNAPK